MSTRKKRKKQRTGDAHERDGETTIARRFTFKIDSIFPLADSQSVPLLRLMKAADDARHLHKLLLSATAQARDSSLLNGLILDGEILHIFKLITGHLYEAGVAFRNLEQTCSRRLDEAVANDDARKADLNYLRQVYATTPTGAFHFAFLNPMRQLGFHYEDEELREAFGGDDFFALLDGFANRISRGKAYKGQKSSGYFHSRQICGGIRPVHDKRSPNFIND